MITFTPELESMPDFSKIDGVSPLWMKVMAKYMEENKLCAIRLLRAETGLNLKSSKVLVESMIDALLNTIPKKLKHELLFINRIDEEKHIYTYGPSAQ